MNYKIILLPAINSNQLLIYIIPWIFLTFEPLKMFSNTLFIEGLWEDTFRDFRYCFTSVCRLMLLWIMSIILSIAETGCSYSIWTWSLPPTDLHLPLSNLKQEFCHYETSYAIFAQHVLLKSFHVTQDSFTEFLANRGTKRMRLCKYHLAEELNQAKKTVALFELLPFISTMVGCTWWIKKMQQLLLHFGTHA